METLTSNEVTRIRDSLTVFGQDAISDAEIEAHFGKHNKDGFILRHLLDLALTTLDIK